VTRPSPYARHKLATRVYRDSVQGEQGCKWLWTGFIDSEGRAVIRDFPYRRYAQHAAFELKGDRLWPGDRVVAVCDGGERCMDSRHLHVIPKRPYRAPPKPRAKAPLKSNSSN
jgi:hypothetical protein